ncbi:MAG: GNAT family N-acetyltransferase [Ahrensia sp.]|nr:GNAT family N-acetyltransferase [Ahrensia sp.]
MHEDVVIRKARPADLAACAAIVVDEITSVSYLPDPPDLAEMIDIFEKAAASGRHITVADRGGEIIGYTSTEPRADMVPHLHALYLKPAHREGGVGKRLLDAVKIDWPQGFELTVFELNEDAQRLYLREGLREIPKRRDDDTEEGVPTLLMVWDGEAA